jgi:mannosyltransferase OCH1-like enzyme
MIPKILHFIWVGDESIRPDNCIETWVRHHPDWEIRLWGNASLHEREWTNGSHMQKMSSRELNGVADMMRWEILYSEGGIVIDADSICVQPLDEALLDCEAFACWESEMARPGLIAAGYVGACAENAFIGQIILDIRAEPSVIDTMAWKSVGPQRLTDSYRRYRYHALRIFPSHYFIPEHFSGVVYDGPGPIYARQMWASTKDSYANLYRKKFDASGILVEESDMAAATSLAAAPVAHAAAAARDSGTGTPGAGLESLHDPYFVQRVPVSTDLIGHSRLEVFKKLCAGQRVLHIGCADWPITNPKTSLHLALEPHCVRLDGFDIHAEALAALAPHASGRLYSRFEDLTDEYDLILVPEVMEHVPDVAGFLAQLHSLNAPTIVITVPDAYQCHKRHFGYAESSQTFVEIVHPDHNCWYTPYTLSNVIAKYTPWRIDGMWFFNSISLLAVISNQITQSPVTISPATAGNV